MKGHWQRRAQAGLWMGLMLLTGCQTWVGGMTLPSGRYLQHRPQYFPPDPQFPLQKELATMEALNGGPGNVFRNQPPLEAQAAPGPGIAAPGGAGALP